MLLFQKRFHAGLSRGDITLTFRRWERARVKAGGRYRVHPIGVVEVSDVRRVRVGAISEEEARQSGFENLAELRTYMSGALEERMTDSTEVFRVCLHHAGDGDRVQGALDRRLSAAEVAALGEKLRKLDGRSDTGPWTYRTLRLIQKRPRIAASRLAPILKLETAPFKANVVKLKKLGLTQSFEVGYEVSPRGEALLKALRRW